MAMTLVGALAERSAWDAEECSIGLAMRTVGTRSAMLLMREAYYGTTRFGDFADRVGITQAIASARLKSLVEAGLLAKRPYQVEGARTRDEYILTDMGRDLLPAVLALMQWGDTYLQAGVAPLVVQDSSTGSQVRVQIVNEHGQEVDLDNLRLARRTGTGRRPRASRKRSNAS